MTKFLAIFQGNIIADDPADRFAFAVEVEADAKPEAALAYRADGKVYRVETYVDSSAALVKYMADCHNHDVFVTNDFRAPGPLCLKCEVIERRGYCRCEIAANH